MSKEKKSALSKTEELIPELRFPEFVNGGEWKENTLSQVAGYENGKAHEKDIAEDGQYIVVNSKFISSEGETVKYSDKAFCLAKKGDTLMVLSDVPNGKAIAKCFYVNENNKYTVNQRVCKMTPFDCQNHLIYYIMDRNQYFLTFDDGVKQTNLRKDDVQGFPFLLPKSPKEQQKIASCLSSLDELIAAHSDKLEALKDHKKGLMQNLFPQKGQKVPNYRFLEFKKDGEWSEKKLEDVASFSKGKGISKSDIAENGRVPCIRYGELYTLYNETISFVHSYTNLDPTELVLSEANDVIIPASGETQIDIATASCVLEEDIALGSDLNIIKTNINGVFLSYYLNNTKKMDIAQIAQGISVVHLYANQLKILVLNIPKPKEQQKIASCLSALDELIATQSEKIEQLQQHKKGLMQGLFPNTK